MTIQLNSRKLVKSLLKMLAIFVGLGVVVGACSSPMVLTNDPAQRNRGEGTIRGQNEIFNGDAAGTVPTQPVLVEKQEYSGPTNDAGRDSDQDGKVDGGGRGETVKNQSQSIFVGPVVEVPTPQAQPERTDQVPEDTVADQPTIIAGAFLTCVKAQGLLCALDQSQGRKYDFSASPSPFPSVELMVELNGVPTEVSVDWTYMPTTSRWHWKILTPNFSLKTVSKVWLKLPSTINRGELYQTDFLLNPVRIGNGTNVRTYDGCRSQTFYDSADAGLTFQKMITLGKPLQNLQITFVRLCGIVRAQDSLVRVLRDGKVVGSAFLPITTGGKQDFSVQFKDLPAGDLTVEAVPGDDLDVDDFMFKDLRLSY